MIYFYLLPVVLISSASASAIAQQAFSDFVDLHRVERHVAAAFVVWALFGWALEQRYAKEAVSLFETCEAHINGELQRLNARVWELLEE